MGTCVPRGPHRIYKFPVHSASAECYLISLYFYSYEPELHPGVTYRIREPKATLKIFSTGSITITAPCVANIQSAVEYIYPLVYPYQKPKTQSDVRLGANVADKLSLTKPGPGRSGKSIPKNGQIKGVSRKRKHDDLDQVIDEDEMIDEDKSDTSDDSD